VLRNGMALISLSPDLQPAAIGTAITNGVIPDHPSNR
jgi:hypothetical protein